MIKKLPNGRWQARHRPIPGGKQVARNFDRKLDAQRWIDEQRAAVVTGQYVDPRAGRLTLASYAAQWEAVQVSSEGTKRIVDNALRLHIVPELGQQPLAAVRPTMVQGFVKKLEVKGLSSGTIRGVYFVLTQVFAAAVDDRLISATPCKRVTLPRIDDEPVVPPEVEDVVAFRDALPEAYRAAAVLLAGAGPRIGELLGLDVEHITFLGRPGVSIERQRRQDGTLGPLKSKKARRVVPLGSVVVEALAAHLAARREAEGVDQVTGPLFVDELGQPLAYRRWRSVAEAAAKSSGVDITAHDLRHFYASVLIAGGASVKVVQERLGHATAVITLTVYAHLFEGEEDRTREVVDAALAPLGANAEDSLRTKGAPQ